MKTEERLRREALSQKLPSASSTPEDGGTKERPQMKPDDRGTDIFSRGTKSQWEDKVLQWECESVDFRVDC